MEEWLNGLRLEYLTVGPALLALVVVVLRGLSANRWIKRRLAISIILLLLAALFSVNTGEWMTEKTAGTLRFLSLTLGIVLAGVALLFNRFKGQAVSDRFPAIVQDALVIGVFAMIAIYDAPDRLLTTSAVGGLVIGLALQDTLGNLFSGLALQTEKPFSVGDWIKAGALIGRVEEITWRATKIRTKAGEFCILPNSLVSKDILVNFSSPSPAVRMERTIGFGYEAHPNHVKDVVLRTIAEVPDILKEPKPDVLLDAYADFSINYRCRFWITDYARSDPIADQFTTLLYYRMEREGLKIPFPIRDVRVVQMEVPLPEQSIEAERRLAFVSGVDLFSTLPESEQQQIAESLQRITFAADETIIRQGAKGDSMFFIDRGSVRIVLEKDGAMSQLAILGDGQYFGEMALLTGDARTASAIAMTDVHAYILRSAAFRAILLKNPAIAEAISVVFAHRKGHLTVKSEELDAVMHVRQEVKDSFLLRIRSFFGLNK